MTLRAVLFDATGTLIEPAAAIGDTYSQVARAHGVQLPGWRLGDAFDRVLRHAPPRVFPDVPPSARADRERAWWRERVRQTFQAADSTARFADFEAFFDALYRAFATGSAWRLRPGARDALETLRREERSMGLVSNFDHRLPDILEAIGIAEFFSVVMLPAECGAAKPDAAIFTAALRAIGVSPAEAIYVGHDPVRDLDGAAAAGLEVVDVDAIGGLGALPATVRQAATLERRSDADPGSA